MPALLSLPSHYSRRSFDGCSVYVEANNEPPPVAVVEDAAPVEAAAPPVVAVPPPDPMKAAVSQVERDAEIKARARASGRRTVSAVTPGVIIGSHAPSATTSAAAPMTQDERDRALKASVSNPTATAHVFSNYAATPGAVPVQNNNEAAAVAATSSLASSMSQAERDLLSKSRAGRPTRRQQQAAAQAEDDAVAKSRARRGYAGVEGPPVMTGSVSLPSWRQVRRHPPKPPKE
jgi:hypothetical protein